MTSSVSKRRSDFTRRILQFAGPGLPFGGPPTLVLTVGLPGSGKSHFSRRLAVATGAVLLQSDALRRLLFAEPKHSSQESRRLFPAMHEAARLLLENGTSVIIDATNLKESDRRPVYSLAQCVGARLLVLRFTAPEGVIRERLKSRLERPDSHDRSTAGWAVYQQMAETAEPIRVSHLSLDTSDAEAVESMLFRLTEEMPGPSRREAAMSSIAEGKSTPEEASLE